MNLVYVTVFGSLICEKCGFWSYSQVVTPEPEKPTKIRAIEL